MEAKEAVPPRTKRPYEKTPARMAASLAALRKAQAALKAQGYKKTPKRDASNLNNLAKANAARRGEAARLAADLEVAFPDPHGRGEGEGTEVLEKVGRTILRRWGSVRRGIRRERRQVMGLLTWAARRAAPASLEELAGGLLGTLLEGCTVGRMEARRWRIRRLLEELQKTRYAGLPWLLNLLAAQVVGVSLEQHRGRRRRGGGKRRPLWPPEADDFEQDEAAAPPAPAEPPHPLPHPGKRLTFDGPELPRRFEDFQALVDRAFCAPQPAPTKGKVRQLLDQLGRALWQRLHLFEQAVEKEKQGLERETEAMGEAVLQYADDVEERRWQIEHVLEVTGVEEEEKALYLGCRQGMAHLLRLRYGPYRGIKRFLEWTEWDDFDGE